MAYSEDLRSRVLACVEAGESKTVVARRFGVSRARQLTAEFVEPVLNRYMGQVEEFANQPKT